MTEPKIFWQDLTWREIQERLPKTQVVLVPTGSIEQHGPHLALEHDSRSSIAVSEAAARKLYPRVLVAPSFFYGVSPHNVSARLPGTLTLRSEIFIGLLMNIFESLRRFGVSRIVCVNGHGGNVEPLKIAVRRARDDLGFDAIAAPNYWDFIPTEEYARTLERGEANPGHAGEFETSMALELFPENVRKNKLPDPEYRDYLGAERITARTRIPLYADEWLKTGNSDDPKVASAEKGRKLFRLAVNGLVAYLEDFVRFEPKYGWHKRI